MSKYRPERIELTTPTLYAGRFVEMLEKYLKPAAKLKRVDESGNTSFVFYPTKGEYFIVSMLFSAIGNKIVNETSQ